DRKDREVLDAFMRATDSLTRRVAAERPEPDVRAFRLHGELNEFPDGLGRAQVRIFSFSLAKVGDGGRIVALGEMRDAAVQICRGQIGIAMDRLVEVGDSAINVSGFERAISSLQNGVRRTRWRRCVRGRRESLE